jgi:hypothetical protein
MRRRRARGNREGRGRRTSVRSSSKCIDASSQCNKIGLSSLVAVCPLLLLAPPEER